MHFTADANKLLMNTYNIKHASIQNDLMPTFDNMEEHAIYEFDRVNINTLSASAIQKYIEFCKKYEIDYS